MSLSLSHFIQGHIQYHFTSINNCKYYKDTLRSVYFLRRRRTKHTCNVRFPTIRGLFHFIRGHFSLLSLFCSRFGTSKQLPFRDCNYLLLLSFLAPFLSISHAMQKKTALPDLPHTSDTSHKNATDPEQQKKVSMNFNDNSFTKAQPLSLYFISLVLKQLENFGLELCYSHNQHANLSFPIGALMHLEFLSSHLKMINVSSQPESSKASRCPEIKNMPDENK